MNNSLFLDVDPSIIEKNVTLKKENEVEEELKHIFKSVQNSTVVKPTPGLCIKSFVKPDNRKIFINVCQTDAIPCPRDITNDELVEILNSETPSSYRIPMSIGEGRMENDKSGNPSMCYDIAINPKFFRKIESIELFRSFFLTIVFEGLQDKYQFEMDMSKYTILKNRKSIGTLQTHRIQKRDKEAIETINKPLIEEIDPSQISVNLHKENKCTDSKINYKQIKECEKIKYRLFKNPSREEDSIIAEFTINDKIKLNDLRLDIGEDRIILESKSTDEIIDFFVPFTIDQNTVKAFLNRNKQILAIEMIASMSA